MKAYLEVLVVVAVVSIVGFLIEAALSSRRVEGPTSISSLTQEQRLDCTVIGLAGDGNPVYRCADNRIYTSE